jgi:CRISPR/Cas system-associated exonuclease Cas4 (RecB family)
LTKYWQVLKDLEVADNIAKTANDALIVISMIKGGYQMEDETVNRQLRAKLVAAIEILNKAATAAAAKITDQEIPLEAYYISYLVSDRFMVPDAKELRETIQMAVNELKDFMENKEKPIDHAIKLLQEITRITSKERQETLIELTRL